MTETMKKDFSIESYKDLLSRIKSRGYKFSGFLDKNLEEGTMLLRHDIDFSLDFALDMARLEHQMNVSATYFILVNTAFYNIFWDKNVKILHEILGCGHQLGLHFDPGPNRSCWEAMSRLCGQQCDILRSASGREIDVVSFHRPSKDFLDSNRPVGGKIHTYMPFYFSEMTYISDSRGQWRYGHPLNSTAFSRGETMHLLIHPIWWCRTQSQSPQDRLNWFVEYHGKKLWENVAAETTVFDATDSSL